ncbi:MAG: hypothetical protein OEM62_02375 [Acidobacteriota bacterium]|nr:hypothetical protein [Acidobacteriota bacterium]
MKASLVRPAVLSAFLAAVSQLAISAQEEPSLVASASAVHLADISATLERIAELLESQAESRRLDLVMQRIEVRARRLAPLETRLRSARSSRGNYQEEQFRLQAQLKSMADRLDSGAMDADELTSMTEHFASELALVTARLRATNDEIAALENEAARYRNEIDDWEAWVDRELGDL